MLRAAHTGSKKSRSSRFVLASAEDYSHRAVGSELHRRVPRFRVRGKSETPCALKRKELVCDSEEEVPTNAEQTSQLDVLVVECEADQRKNLLVRRAGLSEVVRCLRAPRRRPATTVSEGRPGRSTKRRASRSEPRCLPRESPFEKEAQ